MKEEFRFIGAIQLLEFVGLAGVPERGQQRFIEVLGAKGGGRARLFHCNVE